MFLESYSAYTDVCYSLCVQKCFVDDLPKLALILCPSKSVTQRLVGKCTVNDAAG